MSRSPLIFTAHAGLANRLRALVGYRTLAELTGRSLVVYWPTERACRRSCRPSKPQHLRCGRPMNSTGLVRSPSLVGPTDSRQNSVEDR